MGVPCVTMRDETEWVETVESGMNKITGAHKDKIVSTTRSLLNNTPDNKNVDNRDSALAKEIVRILVSL